MRRRALLGVAAAGAAAGCLDAVGRLTAPVPADCPTYPDGRTVCAPGAVDPPAVLEPDRWRLPAGGSGTAEFVLHNRTGEHLEYETVPTLERRASDEWEHVLPVTLPDETTSLPAGETAAWTLATGDPPGVDRDDGRTLDLPDLPPALYALLVTVERADGPLYCAAPFELVESE